MCWTVYGDLKDLGSIAREGNWIPVPDFYLVLHSLSCRKSTVMHSPQFIVIRVVQIGLSLTPRVQFHTRLKRRSFYNALALRSYRNLRTNAMLMHCKNFAVFKRVWNWTLSVSERPIWTIIRVVCVSEGEICSLLHVLLVKQGTVPHDPEQLIPPPIDNVVMIKGVHMLWYFVYACIIMYVFYEYVSIFVCAFMYSETRDTKMRFDDQELYFSTPGARENLLRVRISSYWFPAGTCQSSIFVKGFNQKVITHVHWRWNRSENVSQKQRSNMCYHDYKWRYFSFNNVWSYQLQVSRMSVKCTIYGLRFSNVSAFFFIKVLFGTLAISGNLWYNILYVESNLKLERPQSLNIIRKPPEFLFSVIRPPE